ncbi:zeta toxin-domain-containing protein [Bombardia bombarda]|uniref:Zeta toxin-domain-containing protein n=1 Tax=Bombardia bombarda TaxID=252184 RepID=A0AA39XNH4_9PEZI|nr:zeta toxin-domain-containing protein [Bombardia bombarda]
MAGGIPNEWKLTPEERLSIFNTEITKHELDPYIHKPNPKPSSNQPLAVIIVGQTGAGKTRLAPELLQAMTTTTTTTAHSPSPAHFIADTYKTYHPRYADCLRTSPGKASALAGLDARVWLTMACEHAAAHRLDVLVESACRHPDDFCNLATVFHAAGYAVRVAILAVPEALSRLGILVRYYRNLPEAQSRGLPPRLTPKAVHDDSYAGLAYAARFIDEDEAVDGVIVVRRNNMLAYRNERRRDDGEGQRVWKSDAAASGALEMERARPLSEDEWRTARADIDELRGLGDPKVDAQIAEIEACMPLGPGASVGGNGGEPSPPLEPLHAADFIGGGVGQ